ncbi:reverse transcriptase [Tanacetum coccineum]
MPPRRTRNINDVYERIMARMKERLDQFNEELGNPFFEGDCSSSNEWGDYDVAGDDYEGAPVFDDDYEEAPVFNDDQFEEESMPVYDTDIEDVIEEEEEFVGKGGFGEEEENMEDIVVVANDLYSSMIQTTLSVDFSKTINLNPHELIWSQKGNLVDVSILIGKKYQEGYLKAKPMDDKLGFKTIKYTWDGFVLKRKGKIVVRNDELLKTTIIKHFHIDAVGGHSGTNVTSHRLEPYFTGNECIKGSKGSQGNVTYVRDKILICQLIYVIYSPYKYMRKYGVSHPYTASSVAQVLLDFVYKLHGLPSSIISDRVVVFLSNFWQSLFRLLKVNLKMSITYHPQTDGQTEVVNKCLECSLRFMYGQAPPLHVPYVAGESDVEVVNKTLQAREIAIEMLKFYLKRAQVHNERMYVIREKGILPHCGVDGLLSVEPKVILDRRMVKLNNKVVVYILVKWVNHSDEDATWELYDYLIQRFPDLQMDS